ncbi:MAG: pantetheine-phosphate adenylyltransferase [Amphiplicatus sp.]
MAKRTAVYPGTFDPITNGHVDIIRRATRLVDHLVVGVAANPGKGPIFGLDDRLDMVRTEVGEIARENGTEIEVVSFSNLLMHFAAECGAVMIIRGLRAVTDFDYEFQMVGMNARVNPEIETVFLMASEHHTFISSRFVKEIALLGGDVTSFVPPRVHTRLMAQVSNLTGSPSE